MDTTTNDLDDDCSNSSSSSSSSNSNNNNRNNNNNNNNNNGIYRPVTEEEECDLPWSPFQQRGHQRFHSHIHSHSHHHQSSNNAKVVIHKIPSRAAMEHRWNERRRIQNDSLAHVRTTQNEDYVPSVRRHICISLHHRSMYGGTSRPVARIEYQRSKQLYNDNNNNNNNNNTSSHQSPTRVKKNSVTNVNSSSSSTSMLLGDQSPSTVLESPVHKKPITTTATNDDAMDRRQRRDPIHSLDAYVDDDDEELVDDISETILSTERSNTGLLYPISILSEIRHYGEAFASMKYKCNFLAHLGGKPMIQPESTNDPSQQQQIHQQYQQQPQPQQRSAASRPHNTAANSTAVSTISVAFSTDGATMASTHGDHTVKVSCCSTGRLLQSLEGHPRTPWTVKYHPRHSNIIASGCLGHQVRIWDWKTNVCLEMIRLEYAIISLSFHPTGTILAIANGSRLHFWGVNDVVESSSNSSGNANDDDLLNEVTATDDADLEIEMLTTTTNEDDDDATTDTTAAAQAQQQIRRRQQTQRSSLLIEMDLYHMLRCVHFPPNGTTLIVGGVNNPTEQQQQRNRQSPPVMSFYLKLWDFDLSVALDYNTSTGGTANNSTASHHHHRSVIVHPRIVVPRALLYNDGGFDVSQDGKTLCACAEYWLPHKVDSAMDLVGTEEQLYSREQLKQEEAVYVIKDSSSSSNSNSLVDAIMESIPMDTNTTDSNPDNCSDVMSTTADDTPMTLNTAGTTHYRSQSFRDGMDQILESTVMSSPDTPNASSTAENNNAASPESYQQQVPTAAPFQSSGRVGSAGFQPRTPPVSIEPTRYRNLSPPPPPGRMVASGNGGNGMMHHHPRAINAGGRMVPSQGGRTAATLQHHVHHQQQQYNHQQRRSRGQPPQRGLSTPPPPPAPSGDTIHHAVNASAATGSGAPTMRPPHSLSVIATPNFPTSAAVMATSTSDYYRSHGRYVPHVVTVSLDTSPLSFDDTYQQDHPHCAAMARGYRPRLGQLIDACPLDPRKASAVTCVKFSPSTNFCLIGYGVREREAVDVTNAGAAAVNSHPVTAIYRLRSSGSGVMEHVSTMLSGDDDVNIARFHPHSGHGFIYGTKQGRVRILSPRPWNYYY